MELAIEIASRNLEESEKLEINIIHDLLLSAESAVESTFINAVAEKEAKFGCVVFLRQKYLGFHRLRPPRPLFLPRLSLSLSPAD